MTKDLYFIPILSEALQNPDAKQALKLAFDRIKEIGQSSEHERGFRQFLMFMDAASKHSQTLRSSVIENVEEISLHLAYGTQERDSDEQKSIIDMLESVPEWRELFDRFRAEAQDLVQLPSGLGFVLEKDGETVQIPCEEGRGSVGHILPGHYSLSLETGRIIWEGDLTAQDLLWSLAFPKQPLRNPFPCLATYLLIPSTSPLLSPATSLLHLS